MVTTHRMSILAGSCQDLAGNDDLCQNSIIWLFQIRMVDLMFLCNGSRFYVLVSVCKAGYYLDVNIGICLMCTDNKIKKLAGNEPHCDADPACDGTTTVPNQNHTTCGEIIVIYSRIIPVNIMNDFHKINTSLSSKSQNAMLATMALLQAVVIFVLETQ